MIRSHTMAILIAGTLMLAGCHAFKAKPGTTTLEEKPTYQRIDIADKRATAEEQAACAKAGGRVRMAGMLGHDMCVQNMPDAGKICRSSSDCLSRCLADEGMSPNSDQHVTGKCAPTNNPFGCYGTVEGGRFSGVLCVD